MSVLKDIAIRAERQDWVVIRLTAQSGSPPVRSWTATASKQTLVPRLRPRHPGCRRPFITLRRPSQVQATNKTDAERIPDKSALAFPTVDQRIAARQLAQ